MQDAVKYKILVRHMMRKDTYIYLYRRKDSIKFSLKYCVRLYTGLN